MIKKPTSMTGWTAWCQEARALLKQARDPAPHKPTNPKPQGCAHAG
jgi:hypothetical protein